MLAPEVNSTPEAFRSLVDALPVPRRSARLHAIVSEGDWPSTATAAFEMLREIEWVWPSRVDVARDVVRGWVRECVRRGADLDKACWISLNDSHQRLLLECGADGNYIPATGRRCQDRTGCVRNHIFWWDQNRRYTELQLAHVESGWLECPPPCSCVHTEFGLYDRVLVARAAQAQADRRLVCRTALHAHVPNVLATIVSEYLFRFTSIWGPT